MAVQEWLQTQQPDFNHDRICTLVPRWDKNIYVLRNDVWKWCSSLEDMSYSQYC